MIRNIMAKKNGFWKKAKGYVKKEASSIYESKKERFSQEGRQKAREAHTKAIQKERIKAAERKAKERFAKPKAKPKPKYKSFKKYHGMKKLHKKKKKTKKIYYSTATPKKKKPKNDGSLLFGSRFDF